MLSFFFFLKIKSPNPWSFLIFFSYYYHLIFKLATFSILFFLDCVEAFLATYLDDTLRFL